MPRFDRHINAHAHCPACRVAGLDHFYQVDGVPTSSNLLMPSRAEAIAWPRGDLRLAVCRSCGLVTNTAFDPATQQLTGRYEATQACSPTFGKFARQLAGEWIDRYALRGKQVLEIGCGQGEFIAMLCDLADATGWGLDPIIEPGRTPRTNRVQFIAEPYGPKWWHLAPDFAVCRHTLEHIADVATFLQSIAQGLHGGNNAVLAIEVPDNLRVLTEAAFWDLYYEHCSYFDSASLLTALRVAGFEPVRHRLEFGGQYLIVESRRGTPAPATPPDLSSIDRFINECQSKLSFWDAELSVSPGETVVWGSGSKAVGFLTTLGIGDAVAAVVDINPAKHGTFLPGSGHEIIAPSQLQTLLPKRVIVMNPVYVEEIRQSLHELHLAPEILALT